MKEKIINYISSWKTKGYKKGIPDEAPIRLEQLNKVPSYRQICKAILSNDIHLEKLGYQKPKCKAYSDIKRAELIQRGTLKESNQLKLKL
jgi:predicted phosphoadenosine phosphosulfate sulfurtransferase